MDMGRNGRSDSLGRRGWRPPPSPRRVPTHGGSAARAASNRPRRTSAPRQTPGPCTAAGSCRRVYRDVRSAPNPPTPQARGEQAAADLGASIVTGADGNPVAVLAAQLGIPLYEIDTTDTPLMLPGGRNPDARLDQMVRVLGLPVGCAVLCCAVLCCAVPCCAVPCCAVLHWATAGLRSVLVSLAARLGQQIQQARRPHYV